jgi:hypothetical protein
MNDPTLDTVMNRLQYEYAPRVSQMPALKPIIHYSDGHGVPVLRSREVVKVIIDHQGQLIRRTTTYHTVR